MRPLMCLILAACVPSQATLNPADDPGTADPDPGAHRSLVLTSTPFVHTDPITFTVTGLAAGETVILVRSGSIGVGPCPPAAGGVCLDLGGGAKLLDRVVADASGVATYQMTAPSTLAGRHLVVQALVIRGVGGTSSVTSLPIEGDLLDPPSCGNGVLEADEACDLGAANGVQGSTCTATCTDPFPVLAVWDERPTHAGPTWLEPADHDGDGTTEILACSEGWIEAVGVAPDGVRPPMPFGSGDTTEHGVLADLDGDGDLDWITAEGQNEGVLVSSWEGDGFADAVSAVWVQGDRPQRLATADLDADGHLDVVTSLGVSDDVIVLHGDGSTTTLTPGFQSASGGAGAGAVALADLDSDGALDLVVANRDSNDLGVLMGRGDGTFDPATVAPVQLGSTGIDPRDLVLADVSGDGLIDAVTANYSGDVAILSGDGAGGFGAPLVISAGVPSLTDLAVADLDSDGHLDVVAQGDATASVLMGVPGPLVVLAEILSLPSHGADVHLVDADSDGVLDIVVPHEGTNGRGGVHTFVGDGTGGFATPLINELLPILPTITEAADLDGDGNVDLVLEAYGSSSATVLGLGDGRFPPGAATSGFEPGRPAVLDADGDGLDDWAVPIGSNRDVALLWLSGDAVTITVPFSTFFDQADAMAAGDIDGDGDVDLVALSESDTDLEVLVNTGVGWTAQETSFLNTSGVHVRLADVTGDGAADAITPDGTVLRVTEATPLASDPFEPLGASFALGGDEAVWIEVVDVDEDGELDLVTANALTDDVSILRGLGGGTFDAPIVVPAALGGAAGLSVVRVGEVTGDTWPDLVVSQRDRGAIAVMAGLGTLTFTAPQEVVVSTQVEGLVLLDLDEDGVDEIVVSSTDTDTLVVLGR